MALETGSEGRKQPKTLSGIETQTEPSRVGYSSAGNNLKPYQGLKQRLCLALFYLLDGRKQPKTLSGIETTVTKNIKKIAQIGRKQPKTLSGIETVYVIGIAGTFLAGNNLKPYQGLKPSVEC